MAKLIILIVSAFLVAACNGLPRVTPAPTECNTNEVYLPQGKAPNCQTACSTLGDDCNIRYIWAPFGCYCIEGYARDAQNVCIPIKKCPPKPKKPTTIKPTLSTSIAPVTNKCKTNEIWMDHGKDCDTICSTLGEICNTNWFVEPKGCYCKDGFARDAKNVCIAIKKCPPKPKKSTTIKPTPSFAPATTSIAPVTTSVAPEITCITPAPNTCKINEKWMDHGKDCDNDCSTLGEICQTNWFVEPKGCYCEDGFARDVNNVCILISECPPKV